MTRFIYAYANLTDCLSKMAGKLILFGLVVLVSACASPKGLEDINDPYENSNRKMHEFNKGLDQAFFKPVSEVYTDIAPEPVLIGISNFSNYMDIPGSVVNNLLQLNLVEAAKNSGRFIVNSTVGLLGFYDAASDIGLYADDSDFGETLHVWGVGEGAYIELPVLGGSTSRDTVGIVIDSMFNPLTAVLPDYWKLSGTGVKALSMIGERGRFGSTVDSVLYESADSYSQSRLFFLQSRRHELGMEQSEEDYFDPYEDLYGE